MDPIHPDTLLTSHEVGVLLQLNASTVVKWVNDGILPAYRTAGGHRRIRSADLLTFLKEQYQARQVNCPPLTAFTTVMDSGGRGCCWR